MAAIKFDRHQRSVRVTDDPFWPKRIIEGSALATADVLKLVAGAGVELAGKLIGRVKL